MTRKLQQMLTIAGALWLLLFVLVGSAGRAAAAADCQFVLGFKALHAMIPDTVGTCVENEQTSSRPGRHGAADGELACWSGRRPPTTRPSPMATAPGCWAPWGSSSGSIPSNSTGSAT